MAFDFDEAVSTMVGGCGVIGDRQHPVESMAESLAWTGEEEPIDYDDDGFVLRGYTHQRDDARPGKASNGETYIWVWGNVLGFEDDEGYQRREHVGTRSTAEYCARLYDEHGVEFVSRLNGDYLGMVYNREQSTVSVFTDRLGSWRLFFFELEDGTVVFSSHIQSLAKYPPVSLEFDREFVIHHLSDRGGPYGLKTALRGVEMFPPGAVTTFDLDVEPVEREVSVYWKPRFEPSDEPYSYFVDEFVDRFRASVRERTSDRSKRFGLLLSGGSDARLVLGALPEELDVVCFHMADWMSKEARTAERIAMAKGAEFRFLRRDPDYFGRLLNCTPSMWNFEQKFNQAWAEGFMDEIRSAVDVILTGHFCDTMWKGLFVPQLSVNTGPIGNRELPIKLPISSIDDYVREFCPTPASYVDSEVDLRAVMSKNITSANGGIESYGVEFASLDDFVLGMMHYPATTDPFFRQSLRENLVLQMPVLDNRLMDLWLRTPTRYQIRRNIIGSAVEAIAPNLAAIPHAQSGVPVNRSRIAHRLGLLPMNALRRLSPFDAVPADDAGHAPWGDHSNLIRTRSYVEDAIYEHEDVIRSLPFLDLEEAVACYEAHMNGEDRTNELYRLVTFISAPLTNLIASRDRYE